MVPMWMWAPALACGNTFVLKPSEKDPSASLLTAELLKEAGVPDGVFNVVHGDKVAVDALLEHPDVAAISFVGSTPIARYVYETATAHGKRCQALGGAKNHMIVLPGRRHRHGRRRGCLGRLRLGRRALHGGLDASSPSATSPTRSSRRSRQRIPKVKVGDGMEPASEMGPLITREHRDKVASYIERAPRGRDRRRRRPRGLPGDGFFLGAVADRRRDAGDGRLPRTRSSARCSASRASPPTTRRCGS